jgi:hypothetical protein
MKKILVSVITIAIMALFVYVIVLSKQTKPEPEDDGSPYTVYMTDKSVTDDGNICVCEFHIPYTLEDKFIMNKNSPAYKELKARGEFVDTAYTFILRCEDADTHNMSFVDKQTYDAYEVGDTVVQIIQQKKRTKRNYTKIVRLK